MGVNPISSGSPHVRCTPMGVHRTCGEPDMGVHRTCGEPDEIKKNTHPKYFTALFREQADGTHEVVTTVRVPSRSIPPPWGSIRFRLAPRTYDAPPCGPSVRVASLTKSRKIPTRNVLPVFCVREQVQSAGQCQVCVRPQRRGRHPGALLSAANWRIGTPPHPIPLYYPKLPRSKGKF